MAAKKYGTALKGCYYNDMRVLDTSTFVWSRVRVSGVPPLPRFSHTFDVSSTDLILLGGWTFDGNVPKKYPQIP